MIQSIGSIPIYFDDIDNFQDHFNLVRPFLHNEAYWSENWLSNTSSTINLEKNFELPWQDILKDLTGPIDNYINTFEPSKNFHFSITPWLNKYEYGQGQEIHKHTGDGSHFSFAYFLDTQDQNNFNFDLPYIWSDYFNNSKLFKKLGSRIFTPNQKNGRIVIFPSCLDHYVTPNKSNNLRVTISGNIHIE